MKTSWNKFIVWLAQGFGVGRIPLAPGTWGSLVGLGWFCLLTLSGDFRLLLSGTIISVSVAVWVCGNAERILGRQDPPSVVLDEIVAVPLCFFFWAADAWARAGSLPTAGQFFADNWLTVIGVFAAFRFFDVLKPWPIRQSQRLPGGWGIVIDDVLAAVYVNLVMLAALAIFGR
ncbi:MAG TPA: phosphatidylglycerophosphatase A [Verrucomicrobiae bacterium]